MANKYKHPYYNFDKLYSYNALFAGVAGGRGIGKTYGAIKKEIKSALEGDSQFIYMRRYDTELQVAKSTFFSAVGVEFPDWDFRVEGDTAYAALASSRDDKPRDWKEIGFFVALSKTQGQKSVSYPRVRRIIFDEFIAEKDTVRYLGNETYLLESFLLTVDRFQDRCTVLLLANSVSIMNPFFVEWGIEPEKADDKGLLKVRGGDIVFHFPDSEDFKKSIYATRLGKFLAGSDHARYAVENEFSDNHDDLVKKKDPAAIYLFTLETRRGYITVWRNPYNGEMYCQRKRPKSEQVFTLIPENMSDSKVLLDYGDGHLQRMRGTFKMGMMSFDSPATRNAFAEIAKRR